MASTLPKAFSLFDPSPAAKRLFQGPVDALRLISNIDGSEITRKGLADGFAVASLPSAPNASSSMSNIPTAPSTKFSCSVCAVEFTSADSQRDHFKSDWHHLNIRRHVRLLPVLSEAEFKQALGSDAAALGDAPSDEELGSPSASSDESPEASDSDYSDSDSDRDSEHGGPSKSTAQQDEASSSSSGPRVYFASDAFPDQIFSLYRAILFPKRPQLTARELSDMGSREILQGILDLPLISPKTCVLMCSSGHFAGAVFDANATIAHKTFHRYTVRKKRGTAQSTMDAKSGGHAPKSAGAKLRRYNEAMLEQEIRQLLGEWNGHLKECSYIVVHAPGSGKSIFFDPGTSKSTPAIFARDDPRIRKVPFMTRRPTLEEAERLHAQLFMVLKHDTASFTAPQVQQAKESAPDAVPQDRALGEQEPAGESISEVKGEKDARDEDDGDEFAEQENMQDLVDDKEQSPFYLACRKGALAKAEELLREYESSSDESEHHSGLALFLHSLHGQYLWTPLHVAAAKGHPEVVAFLLHAGADPCRKDVYSRTPYTLSASRATRDAFRKFMGAFPDRWNYAGSGITSALTDEQEQDREARRLEKERAKRARKKANKKLQQQQEKEERERKEAEDKQRQEQAEKERLREEARKKFSGNQQPKPTAIPLVSSMNLNPTFSASSRPLPRDTSRPHMNSNARRAAARSSTVTATTSASSSSSTTSSSSAASPSSGRPSQAQRPAAPVHQPSPEEARLLRLRAAEERMRQIAATNLVSSSGTSSSSLSSSSSSSSSAGSPPKCSYCTGAISGTPFDRLSYRYCSMDCLREHKAFLPL